VVAGLAQTLAAQRGDLVGANDQRIGKAARDGTRLVQ
jgi:hypothetical protein